MTALTGSETPSLFNGNREEVFGPPGKGKGFWAGAPSAIAFDGSIYLVFRYRRPVDAGRGMSTVIAQSTDGLIGRHFRTVLTITKDDWEERWGNRIDSFERPELVRTKDGRWQLWTSTALPYSINSKDWSTQTQTADTIAELAKAKPQVVFGNNNRIAYKDPVVELIDGTYYAWMCCHPIHPDLVEFGQEDGNYTELWASDDTVNWHHIESGDIRPVPGTPFSHGTRVAAVIRIAGMSEVALLVDGKASSDENCEERTFLWKGPLLGPYAYVSTDVLGQSEDLDARGLRYATVAMGDGSPVFPMYYELSTSSGHYLAYEPQTAGGLAVSLGLTPA